MKLRFLLFVILSVLASCAVAQTANPPKIFLTKSLGNITISLDTLSGRFAVRCADGKSILFGSQFSNTSHISVKLGKRIYSNYWWIKRNVTPPNVYDLGKGIPENQSDRLRYTWRIHNRDGEYEITQDLTPTQDSSWNEALVQVNIRCLSGAPTTAGVTVQMDIDAGGNDKAPITVNGKIVKYETVYTRDEIPDAWTVMTPEFGKETITGRLTALDCVKPDRIVAGNWQTSGDLGLAVYGYGSVGHLIGDAAVFYEWKEKTLDASNEMRVGTRVGLKTVTEHQVQNRYFGTNFVYPDGYVLIIDAKDTAHITIHRFEDDVYENILTWNKSWDTSCTVAPGHFNVVYSGLPCGRSVNPDSISFYQSRTALLRSDKPIGIQAFSGWLDMEDCVRSVPVVAQEDTIFVYPGGHSHTGLFITNSTDKDNLIDFTTKGIITILYGASSASYYAKGYHYSHPFPDYGSPVFRTEMSMLSWPLFTYYQNYQNTSDDGAGMVIRTSKPSLLWMYSTIGPMFASIADTVLPNYRQEIVSSIDKGGKEFVFIPFQQQYSLAEDLVRVIPSYDGTNVRLSNGGKAFVLNRGDHLDTLMHSASVITSDKPMAVYQYPARMIPLNRSEVQVGAVLSIHPREQWGSKYYSVTGGRNIPALWSYYHTLSYDYPWSPEIHYIRIIKEVNNPDSVYLNGSVVDFSRGSATGNYRFVDISRSAGFDIVECKSAISVTTYGGYGFKNVGTGRLLSYLGYAHIPLYR